MFRCFRWFARFEKRCDFNRFFHASCCKSPNMQFAKSRISKMLYFPGQIAFSRIRCLFQNFEHAISTRGHAFSKTNSEVQNLAGISVILPRPRFVQKFANAIFSWQIAFERRGCLVAKNFEHAILPRSFGSFAKATSFPKLRRCYIFKANRVFQKNKTSSKTSNMQFLAWNFLMYVYIASAQDCIDCASFPDCL